MTEFPWRHGIGIPPQSDAPSPRIGLRRLVVCLLAGRLLPGVLAETGSNLLKSDICAVDVYPAQLMSAAECVPIQD